MLEVGDRPLLVWLPWSVVRGCSLFGVGRSRYRGSYSLPRLVPDRIVPAVFAPDLPQRDASGDGYVE
jgi:hypothetical protein